MSKQAYEAAGQKIEARAKSERKACELQKGRAAGVCVKEAKARQKVAEAELEARYQPGPETVQEARYARAEAEYDIARDKCTDLRGPATDRCVKAAKGAREAAIRLAKVEKVQAVRAAEREAAAERRAHLAKATP